MLGLREESKRKKYQKYQKYQRYQMEHQKNKKLKRRQRQTRLRQRKKRKRQPKRKQRQNQRRMLNRAQHDKGRIMAADLILLKQLRTETGISIADCRKALEETDNDYERAVKWLAKHGIEKAEKKSDRTTLQGIIESYIHANGRIGVLVELLCETDFVARTDEFKHLAHEIALQVSAMNPKDVKTLLKQEYIRDSSKTAQDLIKETIAKLGENIVLKRFSRLEIEY